MTPYQATKMLKMLKRLEAPAAHTDPKDELNEGRSLRDAILLEVPVRPYGDVERQEAKEPGSTYADAEGIALGWLGELNSVRADLDELWTAVDRFVYCNPSRTEWARASENLERVHARLRKPDATAE